MLSKIATLKSIGTTAFYTFCFLLFILSSCTVEETPPENQEKNLEQETVPSSLYKGVFGTHNSNFRGTFGLIIPDKINIEALEENAIGTLTLRNGNIFRAFAIGTEESLKSQSSDFKVFFDSEDLSFTFTLDENDMPKISNVVFKGQSGSILVTEQTANNTVVPVTGTYKCTNCQDQDTSVVGIPLNNEERTFNMLLTKRDGVTQIGIQALVGMLVNTKILVQENCSSTGNYTYCTLSAGENLTTEPISWKGIHRYTSAEGSTENCSTISGEFTIDGGVLGSIKGEFSSDSTCPNNTYYVSPTGNDANLGISPQEAWRSISKLNNIDLKPGDVVLFEAGHDYYGSIYLNEMDGNNSANPVMISSYGTGKATIKAGDGYGIYAYNTAGFKIDNLIIAGSGMNTNNKSGISFYNDLPGDVKLDFVEITNCEVYGFREFGIVIGAWNGNSGFKNVLIENNKVHHCLDVGISSYGEFSSTKTGYAHSNIIVRNCEVFNIKGYNKGKHSGNGILLSDVNNSIISHCTVYDSGSGNTSCGGPVGIWYWDANQVTIQFSEVYNMSSGSGCDGGGFDLDGGVTNGIMQYNYSHDNDGAGFLVGQFEYARPMKNITVRYNISENDAATNGGSIYLFNGQIGNMSDIYVYNNTFYLKEQASNPASAVVKYSKWKPVKNNINFFNNIFYASNGADLISIPSGYDGKFMGNLYYASGNFSIKYKGSVYNSLVGFRASGNETVNGSSLGYQGDPLLINPGNGGSIGFRNKLSSLNSYKLQLGSPAIDAGMNISLNFGKRDFYGNNLSENIVLDIGAHQTKQESTTTNDQIAFQ